MRKTAVLFALLMGVFGDAVGAARPTGRTVARSATVSRTTPRAATQPVGRRLWRVPQQPKRSLAQGPRLRLQPRMLL